MNILIIGNGFDLAHGLPTRYGDFIDNVKNESDFYNFVKQDSHFSKHIFNRVQHSDVFKHMKTRFKSNNGWIDFENELKEIIDIICELPNIFGRFTHIENKEVKSDFILNKDDIWKLSPFAFRILMRRNSSKKHWSQTEFDELERDIHKQIQDFIDLFKEYIIWISQNKMKELAPLNLFNEMEIDHLLSFNYTTTFLELYNTDKKIPSDNICYVHGKVEPYTHTGIVMGIGSDYYDENIHEKYVDFYKFFQCYRYSTNTNYLKWIEQYKSWNSGDEEETYNLSGCKIYIYGHSLDPTDKNILKPFLDLENSIINIYYLDDSNKEQLELNLLKVLGKKSFSKYLTGEQPKIIFIQKDKDAK